MKYTIKLILVDDEELFRSGIAFILKRESNIQILHEASNGSELLDYLKTATVLPDIILMDLKMPLLNGVETTKILRKEYPRIDIIALSSYSSKVFIINMINEGAASYIIKNSPPQEMIKVINKVASQGYYYDNFALEVIQDKQNSNTRVKSIFDDDFLTLREKEVLQLICQQLNTKEIAEKLSISPRTIEVHRKNMLFKTNTKNVAGLVVFAIQNGLVPVDDLLED